MSSGEESLKQAEREALEAGRRFEVAMNGLHDVVDESVNSVAEKVEPILNIKATIRDFAADASQAASQFLAETQTRVISGFQEMDRRPLLTWGFLLLVGGVVGYALGRSKTGILTQSTREVGLDEELRDIA